VEVTAHAFAQSTKPQDSREESIRQGSKDASKSGTHHKADHHQEREHEKKAKESDKADALTRDSVREKHGKRHSDDTQGKDEPHVVAKKEDLRKDAHQADGVKKLGAHEKHSLETTSDSAKHQAEDQHEGHSHSLDKTKKQARSEKQQDGTHAVEKDATHSGIKHSSKEKKEEGAHTLDKEAAHGDSKDTSKKKKDEKLAKGANRVEAAEDAGHTRDMGDSKKDEASTLEEIAKEVEALHLTESELDPDENYHAHKHEAFQVKVTGPEGNELCLSEVHHGYQVRADKCNGAHGQHWYWNKKGGRQLKTLRSATRCLGYMFGKHEHRLAMYPCDDSGPESSHTAWKMDSDGRLRAIDTDRCMAFDEAEDKKVNAFTSLCDE